MWVAVSSSLLYCSAYAMELEPRFAQLGRGGMGLFGSILSVSLASVLFRNSVSFVLCSLCVLFLNRRMLCSVIEVFWSWIRARVVVPLVPVTPRPTGEAYSRDKKRACFQTNLVEFLVIGLKAEPEPVNLANWHLFFFSSPVVSDLRLSASRVKSFFFFFFYFMMDGDLYGGECNIMIEIIESI
ncbi:hypothetical protein RHSIM_Rhsim07G0112200 [Rhododendron simsii]|uniref:Uncharacterized protein n=1 Tax=Rhododendron simsii TaxID=118357 RepID=A0A834GR21_RHOSS|nr:hypothetical protein RHSIM_Rhsim07G0112200 [Rhododendron simsii]